MARPLATLASAGTTTDTGLLGHASLLSTQVYTRVAISKPKAVHAATHPGAKLGRPERRDGQEPDGTPGGGGEGDEAAEPPENQ